MLLLASVIWGSAFVSQSMGMDHVGPYTFQALRTLVGAAVLVPAFLICDRFRNKQNVNADIKDKKKNRGALIKGGILCGIALCIATNLQQLGLVGTDAGKAGFITAMYIVIVPFMGIFIGKKVKFLHVICIALALSGLYLLCVKGAFAFSKYDLLVLGCSVVFSVHILLVDKYAPLTDPIRLCCLQMLVSGIISLVPMFIFERDGFSGIISALPAILYTGILSSGLAYTLQLAGQARTTTFSAGLIMSLESVFSMLSGALVLSQIPTLRESIGALLMFSAIVGAQLAENKITKNKKILKTVQ